MSNLISALCSLTCDSLKHTSTTLLTVLLLDILHTRIRSSTYRKHAEQESVHKHVHWFARALPFLWVAVEQSDRETHSRAFREPAHVARRRAHRFSVSELVTRNGRRARALLLFSAVRSGCGCGAGGGRETHAQQEGACSGRNNCRLVRCVVRVGAGDASSAFHTLHLQLHFAATAAASGASTGRCERNAPETCGVHSEVGVHFEMRA